MNFVKFSIRVNQDYVSRIGRDLFKDRHNLDTFFGRDAKRFARQNVAPRKFDLWIERFVHHSLEFLD